MLDLIELPTFGYKERTIINAAGAVTTAFALDFSTAGERLTRNTAGDRYVAIELAKGSRERVQRHQLEIVVKLREYDCTVLNVAGNSIHSLFHQFQSNPATANRYSPERIQAHIDSFVLEVVKGVHMMHKLTRIHSGGQTGADEAGVKAALALNIDVRCVMPKNYRIRTSGAAGSADVFCNRDDTLERFGAQSQQLLAS